MAKNDIGLGVVGLAIAGVVAWFILKKPGTGWVAGQPRPSPCNGVGDLDSDGKVGPTDIAIVETFLTGAVQPNLEQIRRSDIRGDGNVDIGCITLMEAYYTGVINTFPACSLGM